MKIGFQLKQVRERLAKGLVDKGVLRTEKRNFLLFDMATHPVADVRTKEHVIARVTTLLTATTSAVPPAALDKEGTQARCMRAVALAHKLGEMAEVYQRGPEEAEHFLTFAVEQALRVVKDGNPASALRVDSQGKEREQEQGEGEGERERERFIVLAK